MRAGASALQTPVCVCGGTVCVCVCVRARMGVCVQCLEADTPRVGAREGTQRRQPGGGLVYAHACSHKEEHADTDLQGTVE